MWEAISNILTSQNGVGIFVTSLVLLLLLALLAKLGILRIHTSHLHLGMSSQDRERTIIREQLDWVHTYLKGLEHKICLVALEAKEQCNEYLLKYVLEIVFDEIITWVTLNNIENSDRYITIKQAKIGSLVYAERIPLCYRTSEFNKRLDNWIKEIIIKLVEIRKLYE